MAYPPPPITDFTGLHAVITGGGSGMGRELTVLLAEQGCNVAICDMSDEAMTETIALARQRSSSDVQLTSVVANVTNPDAMHAFAAHVAAEFGTDHIDLLFNNAGVGGAGSFVLSTDSEWDRVFDVCWGGVLNGCRSFRPMLLASLRGQVINTSSVNGMWACLGAHGAHTAYSAAKYAVRGFTEALTVDFRVNAPHLTAMVVMPGHIGTAIMRNSMEHSGLNPKEMDDEQVANTRADLAKRGIDLSTASDEDVRALIVQRVDTFENAAPTTAAEAAQVILDAVRAGAWRLLIGEDADVLDAALRADPTTAYTPEFTQSLLDQGHFRGLVIN